jgi:hypothetical protein
MYIKTWKIIVGCVLALAIAGIAFTSTLPLITIINTRNDDKDRYSQTNVHSCADLLRYCYLVG